MKILTTLISLFFLCSALLMTAPEKYLKTYHANGQLQNSISIKENKKDGPLLSYFEDGKIAVKGFFKKDKRDKQWIFYDKDTGKISAIENYKDGLLEGQQYYYHKNGKIRTKGEYKADERTGFWQVYDEEGNLEMQNIFLDGEKVVSVAMYEPNGMISSSGFLKNGQREGEWKYFDEEGALLYDVTYENGVRNGEWKAYTKDGKILITGFYNNGVILGLE